MASLYLHDCILPLQILKTLETTIQSPAIHEIGFLKLFDSVAYKLSLFVEQCRENNIDQKEIRLLWELCWKKVEDLKVEKGDERIEEICSELLEEKLTGTRPLSNSQPSCFNFNNPTLRLDNLLVLHPPRFLNRLKLQKSLS